MFHGLFLGQGRNSALWREWLGLVCALVWFFSSMYSYYDPFFADTWTVLIFMILLSAGLAASAYLWGKRPEWMGNALPYLTLAGAACTGLIAFLPSAAAAAVYWLSAFLMTPLLCRRLYGVLVYARENIRIRAYISAVSVTIAVQMIWVLLPVPFTLKFPLLTAFVLPGLWRAQARLPKLAPKPLPEQPNTKMSLQILRIALVFLLLILLNFFNTLVHTHVVSQSLTNSDWFSFLTWMLVPVSFLFFAYFTDRGRERLGFSIGILLVLIGCFTALTPGDGVLTTPLLLTGEFGGTITEFCFLTMPLLFFSFSNRPFLVAVSGLIAHTLLSSAVSWTQELWLPQALLQEQIGRPLIIYGALCAVALISLAFAVWRRHEDSTLMSALLGLKRQAEKNITLSVAGANHSREQDWISSLDFVEGEHRIALLMCEGISRAEIAERLQMPVSQVSVHLRNIRGKLIVKPPVGHTPYVLEAAGRYGLTNREKEVFAELLAGRSNAEISSNLYIEDTTVKTHVNKIMKKTGLSNRAELIARARKEGAFPFPD